MLSLQYSQVATQIFYWNSVLNRQVKNEEVDMFKDKAFQHEWNVWIVLSLSHSACWPLENV